MSNTKAPRPRRAPSSAQFERLLFRAYPEWRSRARYQRVKDYDGVTRMYLRLEVPSANPKVAEPMRIDADDGAILVSWFRGMHNHFDWNFDAKDEYQELAVEQIADILADEVRYSYPNENGEMIVRSWLGGRDAN